MSNHFRRYVTVVTDIKTWLWPKNSRSSEVPKSKYKNFRFSICSDAFQDGQVVQTDTRSTQPAACICASHVILGIIRCDNQCVYDSFMLVYPDVIKIKLRNLKVEILAFQDLIWLLLHESTKLPQRYWNALHYEVRFQAANLGKCRQYINKLEGVVLGVYR